MPRCRIGLVCLLALFVAGPAAADPSWSLLCPSAARAMHSVAADSIGDRMIFFGGSDGLGALDDLWVLDLGVTPAWRRWSVLSGPAARYGHTAICDPVTRRMIVFGGTNGTIRFEDVWTLNLTGAPHWQQLTLSGGPGARAFASAIYDAANRRMVVYGGSNDGGTLADAWALSLDGAPAWSPITPSGTIPSDRERHSAIYDPVRNRMIVFGGTGSAVVNDVWSLALSGAPAWTQLTTPGNPPAKPRVRFGHGAVYDAANDRMLVGCGTDGSNWRRDMWELSLGGTPTWTNLGNTTTALLYNYAAAMDARMGRLVMYGGAVEGILNQAWQCTFDGGPVWSALASPRSPSEGRVRTWLVLDPLKRRMLQLGGLSWGSVQDNSVSSMALDGEPEWRRETIVPYSTAMLSEQVFVVDTISRRAVGVGGAPCAVSIASLDTLDLWRRYVPPGGPGPRDQSCAIFDPTRNRVVVFGGRNRETELYSVLGDTWALSLSEPIGWTLLDSGTGPSARRTSSAIFDPVGDRMLLFGGVTADNGYSDELWSYSFGATPGWTRIDLPNPPPGMLMSASAYDPAAQRMLILSYYPARELWSLALNGSPQWSLVSSYATAFPGWGAGLLVDPVANRAVITGGNNYAETWALPLAGSCDAPLVSALPGNLAVTRGESLVLSASASGTTPFTVRWKRDGAELTDGANVTGSHTPVLQVLHAQASDAGSYSATFSNSCGAVASAPAVVTAPCSGSPASPPLGMQAWWDLESTAQGDYIDLAHSTAGSNRAQRTGGALAVPGLAGGALRCFAGTDGLSVPASTMRLSFGSGGYAIEAWIHPFAGSSGNVERMIASRAGSAQTGRGFRFSLKGGRLEFRTEGAGAPVSVVTPDSIVSASAWHHVVLRVVPSSSQGNIYLDGVMVKSFPATNATISSSANLYWGRHENAIPGAEGFNGDLDECFVFTPSSAAADLASIQARAAARCAGARHEFARTPVALLLPRGSSRLPFCAELDNFSATSRTYRWSVSTLVPGGSCPAPGPIEFQPSSGVLTLAPGQRVRVPITARALSSTPGAWCYRFAAANVATLDTIEASGQIAISARALGAGAVPLCELSQRPPFASRAGAVPTHSNGVSEQSVTFRVYNDSTQALPFDYQAVARHTDGSVSARVSVAGAAAGEIASGSVVVGAGDSLDLVLPVSVAGPDPMLDEQVLLASSFGELVAPEVLAAGLVAAAEDSVPAALGVPEPASTDGRAARMFPNPMRTRARLECAVTSHGPLVVGVYDVAGRLVRELARENAEPGLRVFEWDGRNTRDVRCAPGMYFVHVRANGARWGTSVLLLDD